MPRPPVHHPSSGRAQTGRRVRALAALAAIALMAAACGSDDDPAESATTASAPPSSTAPVTTAAPAPTTTDDAAETHAGQQAAIPGIGAAGIGDSLYPMMGNGGYDVGSYLIDLTVDVPTNTLDGTTTIAATAEEDLDRFNLDLRGLEVATIAVDGVEASFERVDDELQITPASPLASGAAFTVEVGYGGVPEPISDPGLPFFQVGWRNDAGVVYVVSEPSGAKSWFPSNNHPTDKATFEFRITTDPDLTVIANGVPQGVDEADGGLATTTWTMDDPMTTYLASIYIGDFELREATGPGGLRIRNYFPPARADEMEERFALTGDMIEFYEGLFAADYPFDEYGSIVLPFATGFALENQTISVHGSDAIDDFIIAHEIMHQWAGNSVTVEDWQDIWMLEGFATYISHLYLVDRGLDSPSDPAGLYDALAATGAGGPAEVPIEDLFGLSVYFRGGMALYALDTEVGRDTFVEILRTYYERNAGESVSTEEFQEIVEEVAGPEALEVLDSWLFGAELPAFPG